MFLAYWNKNKKELNYLNTNDQGFVTVNNENIIVKTNECYTEYIPPTSSFNGHEIELNSDKRYIIHITGCLINNDITFIDDFATIEQYIQNPYYIDVFTDNTHVYRHLLLDTCNALIPLNVTFNTSNSSLLQISTNYSNMSVINNGLVVCIEEI